MRDWNKLKISDMLISKQINDFLKIFENESTALKHVTRY